MLIINVMFINIFNNINKREAVKLVLPWAKTIITLSGNSRGPRENKNLSSDGGTKYCSWKTKQISPTFVKRNFEIENVT